jgi:cystathionine gamma-synthase
MTETGGEWSLRSLIAQGMGWVDEKTHAVTLPVQMSSTFIRDPDNQYRTGYSYGRDSNPAFEQAEAMLTRLEGGASAMVFSSGMASAAACFLALSPGDHVVIGDVMYWALKKWLQDVGSNWGLEIGVFESGDLASLKETLKPGATKIVWLETPANPMWKVTDIEAAADIVHASGGRLIVDNTVATPVLTQPLSLGADLVMHSATKFLNGHSDIVAGALVTAQEDEFWQRIRLQRNHGGAILGGMEAWLLCRGMRTLFLRVAESCRNAQAVAEHFLGHEKILEVIYPGLESDPGHEVASRQMTGGYGGMLSLRLKGGEEAAIAVAANVGLWKRATSLGGVESLIEQRASVEGEGTSVPGDLLRLSCGIENPQDLINDLEQALAAV